MADFSGENLEIVGTTNALLCGAFVGEFLSFGDPGPTPDVTPPVVSNFSPVAGSRLSSAAEAVAFDVTDAGGLALVLVSVRYPSGAEELAHDGAAFAPTFSLSSRAAIANGYRYTLRRRGGWPSSPTIRIFPVDTSGNLV